MKGKTGRCQTCGHPERARIELMLAGGAAARAVARKFKMTHHALSRHWRNHVSQERRAQLMLGPVQRATLAARVSEESESVLDHFRVVRAGLYQLFSAALEAGDRNGGAHVAGRMLQCLDSMARVTGQLAESPLLQQNIAIFMSPEFTQFQARLIRVLSTYPEARAAVIREFETIEEQPAPVRPALTYESRAASA